MTPEELKQDTAAIASDLEAPRLDPARRATEEQNLELFETFAAPHHMALGQRRRQVGHSR